MKKFLFFFCLFLFLFNVQNKSYAIEQNTELSNIQQINSEEQQTVSAQEIAAFIKNLESLQNNKKISALQKYYAEEFINTDGFSKEQIFSLMKKTFDNYPDLKMTYEIKKIISSKEYAMVYLIQNIEAHTKSKSQITNDFGQYNAILHSIVYLKKTNKDWKIYSEVVNYESSILAFGNAKEIIANIKAPQKVLAGDDYCAGINVAIPIGYSAIASINNTQITEKFANETEIFRQVSITNSLLERILRANTNNNNEAIIASVAFTKQSEDMFKKPKIDISGLLVLMRRVDVIAKNKVTANDKNKK